MTQTRFIKAFASNKFGPIGRILLTDNVDDAMNPELALLQPYPFEKIRLLLDGLTPADKPAISLSVGEPKHKAPAIALDALVANLETLEQYPSTRGSDPLRQAIGDWLVRRYQLGSAEELAARHILPVNGTRESLFAIAHCLLDRTSSKRHVLIPNPFYQIYEGATLLAGSTPDFYHIDSNADENLSAITDAQFQQAQMIYVCNPGNPTGSVLSEDGFRKLIEKSQQFDFTIISDECYSEIYRGDKAPCGLLQVAHAMGNTDFNRCLVFHSLSKRSNLPGLRSGFVAGDAALIKQFLQYRTYHGCTMAPPVQHASTAAWKDEQHVIDNRKAYDQKYAAVLPILKPVLDLELPEAGFYLWLKLPVSDEKLTQALLTEQNVAIVPGRYLARDVNGVNPGKDHTRLALVAPLEHCIEAAERIAQCLTKLN